MNSIEFSRRTVRARTRPDSLRADLFLPITSNYKFCGYDILRRFGVLDIYKNPDIPRALEDYPAASGKILHVNSSKSQAGIEHRTLNIESKGADKRGRPGSGCDGRRTRTRTMRGWTEPESNTEHRTPNVQHPTSNQREPAARQHRPTELRIVTSPGSCRISRCGPILSRYWPCRWRS